MQDIAYGIMIISLALFIYWFMCSPKSKKDQPEETRSKKSSIRKSTSASSIEERIRRRKNVQY